LKRGLAAAVLLEVGALIANAATPATDTLSIRGRDQVVRLYGLRGAQAALVASGDGGWVHLGPDVAAFLAGQGYFVVGFDSKAYLAGFTRAGSSLATSDVPGDFAVLVDYAARGSRGLPLLVGVSEGAGLAVLAASDAGLRERLAGVLGLGLPDRCELGWRFRDSIIYLTKGVPDEPSFSSAEFIGRLAPLPVAAIHSSRDEFVPLDEVRRVMQRAAEPKRLWVIQAQSHRFGGSEPELRRTLLDAIAWLQSRR
jgi:fermentation-respiration switch protein FrsA (DUF1100 family)